MHTYQLVAELQGRYRRERDAGVGETIEELRFEPKDWGYFEIVGCEAFVDDTELQRLLSIQERICIGWDYDEDEQVLLEGPLRCWISDYGHNVQVGYVNPNQDQALRAHLVEQAQVFLNGGLVARAYPIMRGPKGELSFVVQSLDATCTRPEHVRKALKTAKRLYYRAKYPDWPCFQDRWPGAFD